MIITFDGNVFVGKTSLIKELASLYDFNIIPEQGFFIKGEILTHAVTAEDQAIFLQSKYLEAENKRCLYLNTTKTSLLDRSFVSMAAHIFALYLVNGIDIRDWFLNEIRRQTESGKVIIPDIFCFIKCNHEIIRERADKNKNRNTDQVYLTEKYLDAIEIFNQAWIQKVNGITLDTEGILPVLLAEKLIKETSSSVLRHRFSNSEIICYLREILMQKNLK